jgi:uncharacterized membrane protein SpoIIM required for sporulation
MKAIVGIFSVAFVVAIIGLLLVEQGWAISTLWGWFVVPLGAPAIGIAAAIGLAATVAVIRPRRSKPSENKGWKEFAIPVMQPLVCVAIGWIAKQYV